MRVDERFLKYVSYWTTSDDENNQKGKDHLARITDRWQEGGTGHMDSMWEKAQEYATEMAEKQARIKDRGR